MKEFRRFDSGRYLKMLKALEAGDRVALFNEKHRGKSLRTYRASLVNGPKWVVMDGAVALKAAVPCTPPYTEEYAHAICRRLNEGRV